MSTSSAEQLGVSLFDAPLAFLLRGSLTIEGQAGTLHPVAHRVHRPLPRIPVLGAKKNSDEPLNKLADEARRAGIRST
jgi:hypothetical protein